MGTLIHFIVFPLFIELSLTNLFAADSQPNFSIVLGDDVGWDAFGCTGYPHARTPHIAWICTGGNHIENIFKRTWNAPKS